MYRSIDLNLDRSKFESSHLLGFTHGFTEDQLSLWCSSTVGSSVLAKVPVNMTECSECFEAYAKCAPEHQVLEFSVELRGGTARLH